MMHRTILLIVTVSSLFFSINAKAAQPSSVIIEGDKAVFDQVSNTITYTGSVQAIQDGLVISGDKLVVTLINKEANAIQTTGAPALLSLQQSTNGATKQTALRASATTIIFAPGSKQLTLNGNASLQQGGNTIRSEQILYDVAARQIRADGKQDRVRMEFDVQEKPVDDAASATAEP
jgi:lipopolysaccharide export system protein LptA